MLLGKARFDYFARSELRTRVIACIDSLRTVPDETDFEPNRKYRNVITSNLIR